MRIAAFMMSCAERQAAREETLVNLSRSDWEGEVAVELDRQSVERRQERQETTALRLLERAQLADADFVLFLEDDLDFNLHLRHNLGQWAPLREVGPRSHFFGSLYNPNIRIQSQEPAQAFFIAEPECVYGSQAFILALPTVGYIVDGWSEVPGMQDIKMSRLAARVCSVYYHMPSLVQHLRVPSVWGGGYHWASDFDPVWRARDA